MSTPRYRTWLGVFTILMIFLIDALLELGVAVAVAYIAVVWLAYSARDPRGVRRAALLCSVLTVVGVIISPAGGEEWKILINRALALAAIWLAAFLSLRVLRLLEGEAARAVAAEEVATASARQQDELRRRTRAMASIMEDLQIERQRLTASEDRFHTAVESAPMAMVMINQQGEIVLINSATEELFGYAREELLGQPIELLIPERFRPEHPEHRNRFFQNPTARSMGSGRDLSGLRQDGTEVPIEIGLNPVKTDNGLFVLSAIVDISDRKQAETKLRESREQALAAHRAKSAFLANMSHEIRTPMNAIIGLSKLLLDTELDHVQEDYLQTVVESSESLLQIINDVLDFSKLEVDKIELAAESFQIQDVVGDTLKSLALAAHGRDLELMHRIAPDVPGVVVGDPGRLRQVLVNLIGNAIKFTEKGHVSLDVAAIDNPSPNGLITLQFAVQDTGIGITADQCAKMFAEFEQADVSTTRKYGGTGLGLAISRRLIEKMHGEIWVDGKEGKGSTFTFTVQLGRSNQRLREPWQNGAEKLAGARVLVVDDHAVNRLILQEMVQSQGMIATLADDGEAALAELHAANDVGTPFDLLLTDGKMPNMDGFELVDAIAKDVRIASTPIVLLTSSCDIARRTGKLGHPNFVRMMKPVKQSELVEAMVRVLGLATAIDEFVVFQHSPDADNPGSTVQALRILVVDDSLPNQKLATALLTRRGHQVVVADNGRDAVTKATGEDFDVVLMDIQMPEMDGFAATAAIRARERATGKRVPIIALTAHALHEDRKRCLSAGMDGFLSKPIIESELWNVIEGAVALSGTAPTVNPQPISRLLAFDPRAALSSMSAGLDVPWEELLQYVGGEPQTLQEIALGYAQEMGEVLEKLPAALDASDTTLLVHFAHKLKSASNFFRAHEIATTAERLEQRGRLGHLGNAQAEFNELSAMVVGLITTVQQQFIADPVASA